MVVYLDDMLIYTKGTKEEYTEKVRIVLEVLLKKGFRAKLSKYEFYIEDFNFLGFRIMLGLVVIDLKKVKAVLEWPEPTTIKEV